MTDPLACPDPIAERRYLYAFGLGEAGEWAAAAELYRQTLELVPNWAPAWAALANAREKLGENEAAAAAYAEALRADPLDRYGAAPRLARLQGRETDALPSAYVARLFDAYAPRFEAHLVESLSYRGPELIVSALDAVAPGRRFAVALDLGCGSGLMGRALRERVGRLVGVDISAGMIAEARARGGYDELAAGDLVGFLEGREADLVVAADTLVYLGDLRPVCAAVARALAPGGLFAFTVESGEAPFALHEALRFAHSDAHLREAAAGAGLEVALLAPASTRREGKEAAAGRVVVLAKA